MSATTATQPLPSRIRRTPPAIRVILVMIVVISALFAIASAGITLIDLAARHEFTTHTSYPDVRRLVVDNSTGDVHLVRAPARSPVTVTAHVTEGLRTPHRSATRSAGGTLRLSASCTDTPFGGAACDVGYTVAVPAGTGLTVDSSGGDVSVRDYAGRAPLAVSSSSGDVDLTGISVPVLRLESSAGDVNGGGIRARVVVAKSTAGDVELTLASPARRLAAESSAGDVRLTVPDVPYRVKASSSAGDVRDGAIRQDPHAARRIDASSSAGDVTIAPPGGG
jgi:putative adhesin